jgi:hypothetical protein
VASYLKRRQVHIEAVPLLGATELVDAAGRVAERISGAVDAAL